MALSDELKAALKSCGYLRPSPIQAAFIPLALTGVDIVGQAQTGTGKTAAFSLPILEKVDPNGGVQALILCPTRELVAQVVDEANRIKGPSPVRVLAVYGGESVRGQSDALNRGVQMVVGTPGRVIDMMRRGRLKTGAIRFIVLDEADRMLDIGFRPDIERILRNVPSDRQTLLLSATMPDQVLRLSKRYMRNPESVNMSTDEVSVERIDQYYFTVDEDLKLGLLLRLLVREKPRQCLIFCQMKTGVRNLASELGKRIRGVLAMRGDLPQSTRNRVMKLFRDGKLRILVATDVVGRGIDVQGISHVINYDIPEDPEMYVHRIGRTGRMGKDGKAYTFVTKEQGPLLSIIERFMNKELKADAIEGFVSSRSRRSDRESRRNNNPVMFLPGRSLRPEDES